MEPRSVDVLAIGTLVADEFGIRDSSGKFRRMQLAAGGDALNVYIALRRLWHSSAVIGCIGGDEQGRFLLSVLQNSGVMIHGQAPETMGKDQNFPVSIEVQLLGDDGSGKRPTGNLCTPGTHVVMNGELETKHCISSTSKTYPIGQWITAEIIVSEGKIKHVIEGDTVLEYSEPQYDEKDADAKRLLGDSADVLIKGGTISLQSESHPVEFRKIEIMELPR